MTNSPVNSDDLKSLARLLGLPADSPLLLQALTHRSFAFEQGGLSHNERLEFLGDSVLSLVVTTELYNRYTKRSEGDLARIRAAIVNTKSLARVARDIGVGPCILLDKGEKVTGGKDKASILADTMEALIGAVYLNNGIEAAHTFICEHFSALFVEAATTKIHTDWKTALQELIASKNLAPPVYQVEAEGPDHAKQFTATAMVDGKPLGHGSGSSKKAAEQGAAEQACAALESGAPSSSAADA